MCTSPSMLYTDGSIRPKSNKRVWRFSPFNPDKMREFKLYRDYWRLNYNYFLVPCGHCAECRLKYRKEWSVRLLNELEMSENGFFITITYDDDHLPPSRSLKKEDVQLFMKSLAQKIRRDYNRTDFKYFLVGEYGDHYLDESGEYRENPLKGRPHYHAILFNVPFNDFTENIPNGDKYIRKCSKIGSNLLYSKTLSDLWSKGFVLADDVSFNSASYVAGYVQKKLYGDLSNLYLDNFLLPPFLILSKNIGKSYFLANKDKLLETDEVIYRQNGKVKSIPLPRYYLKVLEKDDVLAFVVLKDKRSKKNIIADSMINSDYSTIKRYFRNREKTINNRVKRLVRS